MSAGFRGTRGEFFAIGRNGHLVQWVPPTARWETESLTAVPKTGVTVTVLADSWASNGALTRVQPTAVNDYVTYASPSIGPGTYQLTVRVKLASNAGAFLLSKADALNGTYTPQAGSATFDTFATNDGWADIIIGNITLSGTSARYFRFQVKGRNAASSGLQLYPDFIQLAR